MNLVRKLIMVAVYVVVATTQHEQPLPQKSAATPVTITNPTDTQLAGRYYLRNRTNRFYQRAGRGYFRAAMG